MLVLILLLVKLNVLDMVTVPVKVSPKVNRREEMVILLKGSLRIAQTNSFIEDSEEQEEGLKVKSAAI